MRVAVIALLIVCLGSGCGLIMIGEPVKELDLASRDDAEENLKAIRAMLSDQAIRRSEEKPSEAPRAPSSPDEPSSPGDAPAGLRPAPTPSSSLRRPNALATLPWTPSPPDRPAVLDRPVAAYTSPAPIGPDHSGSIRCTPDGMGGQRCLGR